MKRLKTVSESIQIIDEGHADTDQMMYADAIAKALQTNKTELGNVWIVEIIDSSSDIVTGSGSGRIKYLKPAVPDEVDFSVTIENRKSPEPEIGEDGLPIEGSGDNVAEETGDATVAVSINGVAQGEEKFKAQALAGLKDVITSYVMGVVAAYNQKEPPDEVITKTPAAATGNVAGDELAVSNESKRYQRFRKRPFINQAINRRPKNEAKGNPEDLVHDDIVQVLIDSNQGIYIPQIFAKRYNPENSYWVYSTEDWEILKEGPDHPEYNEAWNNVLDTATMEDENETKWCLYQDQDLFAIRDGYAFNDEGEIVNQETGDVVNFGHANEANKPNSLKFIVDYFDTLDDNDDDDWDIAYDILQQAFGIEGRTLDEWRNNADTLKSMLSTAISDTSKADEWIIRVAKYIIPN